MAIDRANDLQAFRDFVDDHLANGESNLTLDEALDLWEYENSSEDERESTMEAIRQGFADVVAGRVRPAREAIAELRRKHNLPELR
ncbi:MAG TPA: hypothetical protein VKA15_03990 [Isosphaeraceae bacterium]|nr:hypothetical protein [Isosphaeraceae bacterium]